MVNHIFMTNMLACLTMAKNSYAQGLFENEQGGVDRGA
jgi:hypothetical protein